MPSLEVMADVFAEERYADNQPAARRGAEDLPYAILQKPGNSGRTNE